MMGHTRIPVDSSAAAKVCKFEHIVCNEDIFRLNIAMEDAVAVHVVHRLGELIHVNLDSVFGNIMSAPANELIDIHVHELKDECESSRRLVIEHFQEFDDVAVRRESPQRLDFAEVVHLVERIEMVFHAFYGDVFPVFDALRLEHLREGAFALFRDEAVLYVRWIGRDARQYTHRFI